MAWHIHSVLPPPLSVSYFLLLCWFLCILCCFWLKYKVFLCSFMCTLRFFVLLHRYYFKLWSVEGILFSTDVDKHIWLADQSKNCKSIQNDLWLVSQLGIFTPGWRSSLNRDVFRVRWEKRSDVHSKDKRIRKKISPKTKASLAKASIFEILNRIEKLHQPKISIDCLSNTTKAIISLFICMVYILTLNHCVSINNC